LFFAKKSLEKIFGLSFDSDPHLTIKAVFGIRIPHQDPYVFGPPGSASGSFINKQKNLKNLDFYCFVTSL
jgi:hypothetical protein